MIKDLATEDSSIITAPPDFGVGRSGTEEQNYGNARFSRDLSREANGGRASFSDERRFNGINGASARESVGDINAAQKVRESIAYMKLRLDRPLQVSVLANHVNISQSHFFAIFKRLTGSTPIDYFIHLRMVQACAMLTNTSASVKEVAGALGYDDPFYFSRVFRSVHGMAPSEYRNLNRTRKPNSEPNPTMADAQRAS